MILYSAKYAVKDARAVDDSDIKKMTAEQAEAELSRLAEVL